MPRGTHPNSLKNLKHGNKETQFESGSRAAVENGRKGALVTNEKKRTKKTEAEEWAQLLSLAMEDGEDEDITSFKGIQGKNITVSKAMKAKMIALALKGDIRAFELVMKYAQTEDETATPEAEESSFIKALNGAAEVWNDDKKK